MVVQRSFFAQTFHSSLDTPSQALRKPVPLWHMSLQWVPPSWSLHSKKENNLIHYYLSTNLSWLKLLDSSVQNVCFIFIHKFLAVWLPLWTQCLFPGTTANQTQTSDQSHSKVSYGWEVKIAPDGL